MRFFLVICLVLASACKADDTPTPCNADDWQALIGEPETAAEVIPDPKRIIPPNTAVTRDYRFERTNVDLDDAGVIVRIWCG